MFPGPLSDLAANARLSRFFWDSSLARTLHRGQRNGLQTHPLITKGYNSERAKRKRGTGQDLKEGVQRSHAPLGRAPSQNAQVSLSLVTNMDVPQGPQLRAFVL